MNQASSVFFYITIFIIHTSCEGLYFKIDYNLRSIECPISGSPKPQFKWFKDNVELTGDRFTITEDGELNINEMQFGDQGDYLCNAQNKFISVNVTRRITGSFLEREKTFALRLNTADYEVRKGESVELKFVAETKHILPVTVNWTHNGTQMKFPINDEFKDPLTQHTVTNWLADGGYEKVKGFRQTRSNGTNIRDSWIIEHALERDSGIYTCAASSALFGNAVIQRQFIIQTTVEGEKRAKNFLSEAVRSLRVVPLSSTALHLSWEKPRKTFGTLIGYKILYIAASTCCLPEWLYFDDKCIIYHCTEQQRQTHFKNITDFRPTSVKLTNLEENTHYEFLVYPVTLAGEGEWTWIREKTRESELSPVEPKLHLLNHTDYNLRYESKLNADTALIIWEPWTDYKTEDFQDSSIGSYFYVKYRLRNESLCYNIIYELDKDYVFIHGLEPSREYEFIVGSVDGIYFTESNLEYPALETPENRKLGRHFVSTRTAFRLFLFIIILMMEVFGIVLCKIYNQKRKPSEEESIPLETSTNRVSNIDERKCKSRIKTMGFMVICAMNIFVFFAVFVHSQPNNLLFETNLCPTLHTSMVIF